MKFQGTDTYVADDDLKLAVNAAITLERPLLIKGEPGTGKTMLAEEVARALDMPLFQWHIKSTTKAQQGLYEYDAVSRLRDSQLGDARVGDIANYIVKGVLWQAFESPQKAVVLVDEIDKADPDVPNGLLIPLGSNQFKVTETADEVRLEEGSHLVVVTTNEERELPQAFLRRCVVVWLEHPDADGLVAIAGKHLDTYEGGMTADDEQLARELAEAVVELRKEMEREASRPPSTAEFLDALRACRELGVTTSSPQWQALRDMALVKQQSG
jgi:MoxR-like ATPase